MSDDSGLTVPPGLSDALGHWEPPKLHCHPDVANWLMLVSAEAKPEFPGEIGSLTGILVFEEPEFDDGTWELRRDGEVVSSGHVDVPYLARKLKIEFRQPDLSAFRRHHLNHWMTP